jgi:hypothetical protein
MNRHEFGRLSSRSILPARSSSRLASGKRIVEKGRPFYSCSTGKRGGGWDSFAEITMGFRGFRRLSPFSKRCV